MTNSGRPIIDLKNERFSRLFVVKNTGKRTRNNKIIWLCRCDCGNLIEVRGDSLKRGGTKSCGCFRKQASSKRYLSQFLLHGESNSRLHGIWRGMKKRCYSSHSVSYPNYGKRGIKVCPEWQNDFLAFKKWALVNGYTDNLTIDRIDNDGDYEPSNCRWITLVENVKRRFQEGH